ncbi:Serine-threonine/tyrosine-protein kinase, catalytic domain [Dillenia turbinata]|uniref:Serine-threonine/tyrosine-protein kinase, catalytic domain n=1 Tax=Dillenia turbinata TaxID=194707 RepID=A0AAN8W159_9MAGN
MKGSEAQVLGLNLGCSDELQSPFFSAVSSPALCPQKLQGRSINHSTPVSSLEDPRSSFTGTTGEASLSCSDTMTSLLLVYKQNPPFEGMEKGKCSTYENLGKSDDALLDRKRMITLSTNPISSTTHKHESVHWIRQNHFEDENTPKSKPDKSTTSRILLDKFLQYDEDARDGELGFSKIIKGVFGKPPRLFEYKELAEATDGFSKLNLLAVGVFGSVHGGILQDGQVVTVKQLNFAASQGNADFHREVQVLSCAQHRNLVLLIGFCIEGRKRLLVYEYNCNGSLDFHLHGKKRTPLDWPSRYKIAIGVARALRYIHEDCRVGCIVHRVVRPDNILLTHNFEPLVADFGPSWWHFVHDFDAGMQDNRTSGCLAPELFNGGKITEKVDVYAFGVGLLELVTGRRVLRVLKGGNAVLPIAMDLNSAGSRSGHMRGLSSLPALEYKRNHSRKLSH